MARPYSALFKIVVAGLAVLALLLAYNGYRETSPPLQDASAGDVYPPRDDIYQVAVRNGAGVHGLAEEMRAYLRKEGYDVVEVGNYKDFDQPMTLVIDRVGDPVIARQVAFSLDLTEDRIRQEIGEEYLLDVTVVIGKDFPTIPPFIDARQKWSAPES